MIVKMPRQSADPLLLRRSPGAGHCMSDHTRAIANDNRESYDAIPLNTGRAADTTRSVVTRRCSALLGGFMVIGRIHVDDA